MPNRHHQASNNYAQTQTSTHFQRHTRTHTHCTPNYPPDTAHKCLYARPSLFRSLQTYICGPCSGLCSLSRRLVTIRSLCCLSSRSHERPRTTEVGGRGRSPLILYIYIYTYMVPAGGRQPPPIVSPPRHPSPGTIPIHTVTYILTLHYIALHCIALHYIHTCLYLPTYVGTYILHPIHPTGGRRGSMYVPCMIVGFQGGSTPNPRNHPHRGGEGGVAGLYHIYLYIFIYIYIITNNQMKF